MLHDSGTTSGRWKRTETWAPLAYVATAAIGVVWGGVDYSDYEWLPTRIVVRDLTLGPILAGWWYLLLICALLVCLSWKLRKSVFGIALGCGAIGFWILSGYALCGLHIT